MCIREQPKFLQNGAFLQRMTICTSLKNPTKQRTKNHWVTLKSGCIAGFLQNWSSFLEDWTKFYISAISYSSPMISGTISDSHHSIHALWDAQAPAKIPGWDQCPQRLLTVSHRKGYWRFYTVSLTDFIKDENGTSVYFRLQRTFRPSYTTQRLRALSQRQFRITFSSHQKKRVKEENP